jgi:hypothetical protein
VPSSSSPVRRPQFVIADGFTGFAEALAEAAHFPANLVPNDQRLT